MVEASLHPRERERLSQLGAYKILDTDPEEAFDDLVQVAARVCRTPIALVSLVDEERQWFKARVGVDAPETLRSMAFCAHAIVDQHDIMVVENALEDERFSNNPLVTDDPRVVFYAGAALITPAGLPMGTLCVIDNRPRELSEEDLDTLRRLARATVNQMELRKAAHELRELAQDVAAANQVLERRDSEIRSFYQHLSHELKTPLTVARDYVSMVLEGLAGEISEEQQEFLQVAQDGCDEMTGHIHDLLDLTRIDTGKIALDLQPLSIVQLIRSAVHALTPSADRAGIRLREETSESLPPVSGDEARLNQVLINLIRNGLKFTDPGGEVVVAARESEEHPGYVGVSVRDTGCGISEQDVGQVFDRLFQCSREDGPAKQGLGLGLHLCREIVELHGGEISVDSLLGKGSTFSFLLPKVPAGDQPSTRQLREQART